MTVFPLSDPRDCYLCGERLRVTDVAGAHRECLSEYRAETEARTCGLCGDPLDDDQPDHALHAACIETLDDDGLPSYRPIEDVDLP